MMGVVVVDDARMEEEEEEKVGKAARLCNHDVVEDCKLDATSEDHSMLSRVKRIPILQSKVRLRAGRLLAETECIIEHQATHIKKWMWNQAIQQFGRVCHHSRQGCHSSFIHMLSEQRATGASPNQQ